MADKTKLTKWLVERRTTMNPRFTEYTWPERYFRGLHDFEARISVGDIESVGRGIDFDQDLAVEKASSEAIERFICQSLRFSSEGFAISGRNSADDHAKNEALERYYFTRQILAREPFRRIYATATLKLAEAFHKQNVDVPINFYQMNTATNWTGVVCLIGGHQGYPLLLGLALSSELDSAVTRAMCEALANFARFKDSPETFLAEVRADKDAWFCNPDYLDGIWPLFVDGASGPNSRPNSLELTPHLARETVDISGIASLRDCPISPVRYKLVRDNESEVRQ